MGARCSSSSAMVRPRTHDLATLAIRNADELCVTAAVQRRRGGHSVVDRGRAGHPAAPPRLSGRHRDRCTDSAAVHSRLRQQHGHPVVRGRGDCPRVAPPFVEMQQSCRRCSHPCGAPPLQRRRTPLATSLHLQAFSVSSGRQVQWPAPTGSERRVFRMAQRPVARAVRAKRRSRGVAASSPAAGSGSCSRSGSAGDSPGARPRPPRRGRPR